LCVTFRAHQGQNLRPQATRPLGAFCWKNQLLELTSSKARGKSQLFKAEAFHGFHISVNPRTWMGDRKATKTGAETVPEPETRADIWWVAELKANEMINEKDIDVFNLMDLT